MNKTDELIFKVIDKQTGKEADIQQITQEDWAQRLVYTDMMGFLISQEGGLYLADTCGNFVPCNYERFKVFFTDAQRRCL